MNRVENIPREFEAIKDNNEAILWSDQPVFIPFMMQAVPFLMLGIVWFLINSTFYRFMFEDGFMFAGFSSFALLFVVVHQFPLIASVLNAIRLLLVFKNTVYGFSNKRVMLRTGFFGTDFKVVDYDKIQNLEVNVNPIEKLFHVGKIRIYSGEVSVRNNQSHPKYTVFYAIKNPYDVFKQLKSVSLDIKTDWSYPNDYRPEQNKGYNTEYRK